VQTPHEKEERVKKLEGKIIYHKEGGTKKARNARGFAHPNKRQTKGTCTRGGE